MSELNTIETFPKDGKFRDVWAKKWRAKSNDFVWKRFVNCYIPKHVPDNYTNILECLKGIPTDEWRPIYWTEVECPKDATEISL